MWWFKLLPTIVGTVWELIKVIREMQKDGTDIKNCQVSLKEKCK
jgi:hypothetical protein